MTNIGVFCSSLDGEKIFSEKAIELGALLAKENYSLVYGGGKLGLMGDLAKSCLLYTSPSPRDKRQSRMPSSA